MLSKVCITPPKAFLRAASVSAISAEPNTFPLGIRQSVNVIAAVSETRNPILSSVRTTSIPGVPASTTKDLIAALPLLLSNVAQTTTALPRSPAVQKIFSPLRTHSSPSSVAVVCTPAESEPTPGSVIAIAAHNLPNRSFCSGVATAEIAALPKPTPGIASINPTQPAAISIVVTIPVILPALRTLFDSPPSSSPDKAAIGLSPPPAPPLIIFPKGSSTDFQSAIIFAKDFVLCCHTYEKWDETLPSPSFSPFVAYS